MQKHTVQGARHCHGIFFEYGGEAKDRACNAMAAVKVRCLEEVNLTTIPVQHFDGRSK